MKTLCITSLLLLLVLLAYVLPAALAPPRPLATGGSPAPAGLLRYHWLRSTELPQVLAWLGVGGAFTEPVPGNAAPEALTSR